MRGHTFTHIKSGKNYIVTDECGIKHHGSWVAGVVYKPIGEHPLKQASRTYVRFIEDFEKSFERTYPDSDARLQL